MGEMADALFDTAYDPDNDWDDRGKTCRFCGMDYLVWKNIGSKELPKWRLAETDGTLHECLKHRQ